MLRIPDIELEILGNLYRLLCGNSEILVIQGSVFIFERFLNLCLDESKTAEECHGNIRKTAICS